MKYYCGPCNWSGNIPKPTSGHPHCPDCEAYLSVEPTPTFTQIVKNKLLTPPEFWAYIATLP